MKQFLFCSTVFGKQQYSILFIKDEEDTVTKINYLLIHRQDAVFWPLFTKEDVQECLPMDKSLTKLLRGIIVGSKSCRIRYNGGIYRVDEIKSSSEIQGYWSVRTQIGECSIDPASIEFM